MQQTTFVLNHPYQMHLMSAAGDVDWKRMLKDFWEPFDANISEVSPVAVKEVIDVLDAMLGPHFLPPKVPLN